jgi:hypothetical protein
MKKFLFFFLFVVLWMPAIADIAPNPIEIRSIIPRGECKVQMVSEIVTADVYKDSSVVECVFYMKNWGEGCTMQVGFPMMDLYHFPLSEVGISDMRSFIELYVGDKKVDLDSLYIPEEITALRARMKLRDEYFTKSYAAARDSLFRVYGSRGTDYQNAVNKFRDDFQKNDTTFKDVPAASTVWRRFRNTPYNVWNVTFDALGSQKITVRYRVPTGRIYKSSSRYFYYILHTGAGWYKDIEQARVRVRVMDFDLSKVSETRPSHYRINHAAREHVWDFVHFEPSEEDNVYFRFETQGP